MILVRSYVPLILYYEVLVCEGVLCVEWRSNHVEPLMLDSVLRFTTNGNIGLTVCH